MCQSIMFPITLKIYIKLEMTEWIYAQIKNNHCKGWITHMKELCQTASPENCHTIFMCNINCTKYSKNTYRELSAILIICLLGEIAANE